jgi:hypothetical protein
MNTTLNVILAALALGLALAAIGGETWNKNEHGFLRQLTCRGWISIILILAIFGVTILKEIRASQREQVAERAKQNTELRLHALLQEKLTATEENLAHLIIQKNGSAVRPDPLVVEAERSIQQLRKEMATLRKPVSTLSPAQNRDAPSHSPPRQKNRRVDDEYDELSKPTMEVK